MIYYEAVVVHAQQLTLPVGTRTGGPRSRLLYRLTESFGNLTDLSDRTASVIVSPHGSRVMVNGVSFLDDPVSVETNAVDQMARAGRDILYDIHLRVENNRELSRYDSRHRKDPKDFEADLRRLARAGADVYNSLFEHSLPWQTLPALVRHEAHARSRPATLCIAEPPDIRRSAGHVPWSLVYDLPVGTDPKAYRPCESVRRFGVGGGEEPIPPHCPISDHAGEEDVLCPFGFWGLSCFIEQPPSVDRDMRQTVTDSALPVSLLIATGDDLDKKITDQHLTNLRAALGNGIVHPQIRHAEDLAIALAREDMDVAYLYCHCGYQKLSQRADPSVSLWFGYQQVGPLDISKWTRSHRIWPKPHWPNRKPLVVINGCHTVDLTSSTLSDFVGTFVNRAGASGVVGTEVAIEQGLASFLMELFLVQIASGASAGEALRNARWKLLSRGNVMGLAYTPYCLSGLRVRPLSEQEMAA
jgi:hypothetical protein